MSSNTANNKHSNHLDEQEARWFAVYTKYRSEKFVVGLLKGKGIEAYVPLSKRIKKYASKVKSYHVPLISCYVFVKILKKDYLSVLKTPYILSFVRQKKDLISIPEEEMELMRRIVGEKYNATISEDKDLEIGDTVEILSGQLTGLVGKMISNKGKHNVLVELESIGHHFQIEVPPDLLMKKI